MAESRTGGFKITSVGKRYIAHPDVRRRNFFVNEGELDVALSFMPMANLTSKPISHVNSREETTG